MDNEKIIIVDYGVGNVLSLSRAVKKCKKIAILTDDPKEIESATQDSYQEWEPLKVQ